MPGLHHVSDETFLVIGSQLLMGINKLKIVLNWKNTTLFAKTRVTYKTVFPCNSLRSGSTGHVYTILLYPPPQFLWWMYTHFYCFSESQFKQGFASSAEPARQCPVKFNSVLVPILMGSMSSWMPWKWKVTAWPSCRGPLVVILIWGQKKK